MAVSVKREKVQPEALPAKRATRVRAGRLLAALKDVIGAIETRNTIPILAHVLIEAGHGLIRLTGSNLDMEARRECGSDDKGEPDSADWCAGIAPFAVTVSGKALQSVLAGFDGDAMVTLTVDDVNERLTVAAGRARFRLATMAAADFPQLRGFDVAHEFGIGASVLGDAINAVEHAISTEEARYYLNGIYVHPEVLDLCLAATDGHRLARLKLDAPDGAHSWPSMIVPRGLVSELGKALAHAAKAEENAQVIVRCNDGGKVMSFTMPAAEDGELTLISKAIDGTFPDYMRVIPVNSPRALTVSRENLAGAVARVAALAHKDTRLIRLDIDEDRIDLTVTNADIGDAREEVPAAHEGEPQAIGFDVRYLREVLGKIASDEIVIRWTDGGAPVRIEAKDAASAEEVPRMAHVLMPMRV